MKLYNLLIPFLGLYPALFFAQNWQQLGDFNKPPNKLYPDSVTDLLYIGGSFKWNNADTLNGICYWDGQQFHNMEEGLYDACGFNVCHSGPLITRYLNDIYIGNVFKEIDSIYANGIAKWDGEDWSSVDESLNGDDGQGVAWGGHVYEDKLYVVGSFRTAGNDTCNSVAYWDGFQWHSLGFPADLSGETPNNYNCIFYKNELYVSGNCYNNIGGNVNRDIARFNGNTWNQVGGGLKGGDSNVRDMIIYKNELYICGYFTSVAGNAGNKIMRWDGEQWKDVGGGLCGTFDIAEDMMVYNDKLYLIGIFDCVGNSLPTNNIAVWDGQQWCSFGNSIFNNKLTSIAVWNDEIYITGGFTEIDGQPVKYLAKWVGDHSTDTCSAPIVATPEPQQGAAAYLTVSPNPVCSAAALSLEGMATSGKPVRFSIFNPLGQEVWSVASASGREEVSLAGWPPGAYVARAESEEGVVAKVFVKK